MAAPMGGTVPEPHSHRTVTPHCNPNPKVLCYVAGVALAWGVAPASEVAALNGVSTRARSRRGRRGGEGLGSSEAEAEEVTLIGAGSGSGDGAAAVALRGGPGAG